MSGRPARTYEETMSASKLPVVKFDDTQAVRVFPRPELKTAALVSVPLLEGGVELPSFIVAEWGGIQQFLGDYYAIIRDGEVVYGSAQVQWDLMHTMLSPGVWVKTGIPTAYQATEPCRITTLILLEDGAVRETSVELEPGAWIMRQPGGEVQHVREEKMPKIYFTQEEAETLGLTEMDQATFATWALRQATLQVF